MDLASSFLQYVQRCPHVMQSIQVVGVVGFFLGKPTTWGLPKYTLRYVSGQTNVVGWKKINPDWVDVFFRIWTWPIFQPAAMWSFTRGGYIFGGFSPNPGIHKGSGKLESRSSSNHWFYTVFRAFRAFMDIHLWFFGSRKKTAVWFHEGFELCLLGEVCFQQICWKFWHPWWGDPIPTWMPCIIVCSDIPSSPIYYYCIDGYDSPYWRLTVVEVFDQDTGIPIPMFASP